MLRGTRWDPPFWHNPAAPLLASCGLPVAPLGQFIAHITYGPIVTARRPEPVPSGVTIIDQRAIRPTGVVLEQAVVVAEGSVYDLPRCRLDPGDIVLSRSGAGTLAKRRFTVFAEPITATVSCFVDLIRLRGLAPYYAATFLRCPLGWGQVERLINGVGTPNLSFPEIRSLRIPLLPAPEQAELTAAWRPIERLHADGRLDDALARLDQLAHQLAHRLAPPAG